MVPLATSKAFLRTVSSCLRNVPGNEDHFSDEASGAEELSDEVHQDRGAE